MTSLSRLVLVLVAGLGVAACAALPREELQPTERGEIKTGTNITREREATKPMSGPSVSPMIPSAPAVGSGGSRGG